MTRIYDIYKCNEDDSARYLLGKNGGKKIFVVGLNPSTANKEKSDTTVAKIAGVVARSKKYGKDYDGFVVINLYPLRSTYPDNLPPNDNQELIKENIKEIITYAAKEDAPVFWAAWGKNIIIRPYLTESLQKLIPEVARIGGSWVNYGDLLLAGHPRHPSRLSYSWKFHQFDIDQYIRIFT